MQFFVKSQLEFSQLMQQGSRIGNNSNNKNNMNAIVNNDHSN